MNRVENADRLERVGRVGRKLNSGTDLRELLRLLQNARSTPDPGDGECERQTTNPTADDEHS